MASYARLAALLAAASVLGLAQAAAAQTPPRPADDANTYDANEIIVTAQKREERLKDVPSSIAVLGGADLRDQGADSLEDYAARVPGLSLNSRGLGQQQLSIRGISTGTGYGSTVATYIDDAPVGASNGSGTGGLVSPEIDSIDLARIEVLRGPQGTLYGASNIGGLVKYVTVAPNLSHADIAASFEGSTLSHGDEGYAIRGRLSVPLVEDKVAVLLSGYVRRDPGFIEDAGRGVKDLDSLDTVGARAALVLKPIDRMTITLAAVGQNKSTNGFTQVDVDADTFAPLYGNYQQRRAAGADFQRTRVRLYSASIGYDLDWSQLIWTTSYNTVYHRGSTDETNLFSSFFPDNFDYPNLAYGAFDEIRQNKLSHELRFSGKIADSVDWIVGGYYTRERSNTFVTFLTLDATTGQSLDLVDLLDSRIIGRYRELSAFGQLTYHFSPRFELTAGLRHASQKQNDVSTAAGLLVGPESTTPTASKGSATTFTVAPSFKISDDVTLYARVATGYRPGGSNIADAPVLNYDPDRLTNYEIGIKGAMDGGRLTFELDAFHIDWTKIQLQLQSPTTGLSYTDNAGKARSRGVEASFGYAPSRAFNIGASATYIDAQLERDLPAGQYGLKGDALPYSPKWKLAATADYRTDIGSSLEGFAGASLFYTSAVDGDFRGTVDDARGRLPAYTTVDGRIGLKMDQWTLALLAKNIFDKRGYNGIKFLSPDIATLNIVQPRSVSLSLRYNY